MFTGTNGKDNRYRMMRELQTMESVLSQYVEACERFDDKQGKEVLRDVIGCMKLAKTCLEWTTIQV